MWEISQQSETLLASLEELHFMRLVGTASSATLLQLSTLRLALPKCYRVSCHW